MRAHVAYEPNINSVEIEITHRCNLGCTHCDRYLGVAPDPTDMSVAQIEHFVSETLKSEWKWRKIVVMGGEPTMHPDLPGVMSALSRLVERDDGCIFTFVTNGHHQPVELPPGWQYSSSAAVKRTMRAGVIGDFGNVLVAPFESAPSGRLLLSCKIAATCGLGLSRFGYAPCGAGGAVARVLGMQDVFAMSLEEVTRQWSIDAQRMLCALCGQNLNYEIKCRDFAGAGEFWRNAVLNYVASPPELRTYGN